MVNVCDLFARVESNILIITIKAVTTDSSLLSLVVGVMSDPFSV